MHFFNPIPTWLQMKRTALHRASLQGHTEVVEKLLKHGADINFKDQVRPRRDCARLSSHAKAAASVGQALAAIYSGGSRLLCVSAGLPGPPLGLQGGQPGGHQGPEEPRRRPQRQR